MSRIRTDIAACLMLAGLVAAQADAPGPPTPTRALTNEDIVRMTVAGMPAEAIVKAIEEATTTAFDLDPEVVEELRLAKVADVVIEAMRRAQPAAPAPEPGTEPATESAKGKLVLVFEGNRAKPNSWTAVAPAQDREGGTTLLAFFALCLDPTHVPHQWQTLTPLVDGFPRHQLIWFHEATVPLKQGSRDGPVHLDLPQSHELPIEAGRHPLLVGVAARAGSQAWANVAHAEVLAQAWPDRDTRIRIGISTRKMPAAGLYVHSCKVLGVDPPPSDAEDADP